MARYRVEIVNTEDNSIVEIYETNEGKPIDAWMKLMDWIVNRQLATTEEARITTIEV